MIRTAWRDELLALALVTGFITAVVVGILLVILPLAADGGL
jgi:hypothetical protein